MPEDESTISATLHDGSEVDYVMRGLKEEEIKPWAQFCASVFSYKPCPPAASYFERHYYNDPNRNASLIRVMIYQGEVVSSCRIFERRVSVGGGETVLSGGIGEVCTDANHRKRGLSKILLQDAIRIMKERGMQLSLLHAAPVFFSVYERAGGYACVPSKWSVVDVDRARLTDKVADFHIRRAQFPRDTPQLQSIHQKYSERRFVGCIVRSEAYWNDYISKELEGSLWTLVNENDAVVAWLSSRPRGECYQLRDFGCDTSAIASSDAMSMLLSAAMCDNERICLHLPTAIVEELREASWIDWSTLVTEDDNGWMYKTLQDDQKSMLELTKTRDHLIWPADSF